MQGYKNVTVYVTEITYVPEETFPGAHGYLSEYKAGKERVLAEIRQTADYDGDGTITRRPVYRHD